MNTEILMKGIDLAIKAGIFATLAVGVRKLAKANNTQEVTETVVAEEEIHNEGA